MGSGIGDIAGDVGAVKKMFGQQTDDEKAQGPGTGLSGGQIFARQAIAGGLSGLGKGLQGMQQQPGSMPKQAMPPIQAPQQPLVDPAMFGRKNNSFFGQ